MDNGARPEADKNIADMAMNGAGVQRYCTIS